MTSASALCSNCRCLDLRTSPSCLQPGSEPQISRSGEGFTRHPLPGHGVETAQDRPSHWARGGMKPKGGIVGSVTPVMVILREMSQDKENCPANVTARKAKGRKPQRGGQHGNFELRTTLRGQECPAGASEFWAWNVGLLEAIFRNRMGFSKQFLQRRCLGFHERTYLSGLFQKDSKSKDAFEIRLATQPSQGAKAGRMKLWQLSLHRSHNEWKIQLMANFHPTAIFTVQELTRSYTKLY